MENRRWWQTLELYFDLNKTYKNFGVVIQSYLRRSENDIKLLVKKKANVRLCKGIYKEPPGIAFQSADEISENYKFVGKSNKENMVFTKNGRQVKVTPRGMVL